MTEANSKVTMVSDRSRWTGGGAVELEGLRRKGYDFNFSTAECRSAGSSSGLSLELSSQRPTNPDCRRGRNTDSRRSLERNLEFSNSQVGVKTKVRSC